MAVQTIEFLKTEFETGDRPIWLNFGDLIDSCHNAKVRTLRDPNGNVKLQVNLNGVSMLGNVEVTIGAALGNSSSNNTIISGILNAPEANINKIPYVATLNATNIETLNALHIESSLIFDKTSRKEIGSSSKKFANVNVGNQIETCISIFRDDAGVTAATEGITVAINENNDLAVIE